MKALAIISIKPEERDSMTVLFIRPDSYSSEVFLGDAEMRSYLVGRIGIKLIVKAAVVVVVRRLSVSQNEAGNPKGICENVGYCQKHYRNALKNKKGNYNTPA